MLNIEASINEIQNIIKYFTECDVNNKYYEGEKKVVWVS